MKNERKKGRMQKGYGKTVRARRKVKGMVGEGVMERVRKGKRGREKEKEEGIREEGREREGGREREKEGGM